MLFLCLLRWSCDFFILCFVSVVYHVDWFVDIKPSLHPWNKPHLIIKYYYFNVLLNFGLIMFCGLKLKLKLQYFGHLMGRTDSFGKDPDAGKDWRQEEKGSTENEMIGWHHRLNGHEFEQTLGAGDGQGSLLQSMGLQRVAHDWAPELNWTETFSWVILIELLGSIFSWSPVSSVQGRVQSGIQVSGLLTCISFLWFSFWQPGPPGAPAWRCEQESLGSSLSFRRLQSSV